MTHLIVSVHYEFWIHLVLGRLFANFYQGDDFCDFLFANLLISFWKEVFSKRYKFAPFEKKQQTEPTLKPHQSLIFGIRSFSKWTGKKIA